MYFIAHRGNTHGRIEENENHPEYVIDALKHAHYVEVDVWRINHQMYLGHDFPQYNIPPSFFDDPKIIFHAKNMDALLWMMDKNIHCFWHNFSEACITSKQWVWVYPEVYVRGQLFGICADKKPEFIA